MDSFIERMKTEKSDLQTKIDALEDFFNTDIYKDLPYVKQHLLNDQVIAMSTYSNILLARLALETNG